MVTEAAVAQIFLNLTSGMNMVISKSNAKYATHHIECFQIQVFLVVHVFAKNVMDMVINSKKVEKKRNAKKENLQKLEKTEPLNVILKSIRIRKKRREAPVLAHQALVVQIDERIYVLRLVIILKIK